MRTTSGASTSDRRTGPHSTTTTSLQRGLQVEGLQFVGQIAAGGLLALRVPAEDAIGVDVHQPRAAGLDGVAAGDRTSAT